MFTFSKLGVKQTKKMLLTLQNSLVGGGINTSQRL